MKRYDLRWDDNFTDIEVLEDEQGEWVLWEDVKEIIEEYQKMINEGQEDINYL